MQEPVEYSEADTRAKLIDPALHRQGWTEDFIRREETAGSIEIISGKARRRARGRADYVLRYKLRANTQPVALALIEAKRNTLPPGHGLDQGKGYATCNRLNVRFVFSSNGYQSLKNCNHTILDHSLNFSGAALSPAKFGVKIISGPFKSLNDSNRRLTSSIDTPSAVM